MNDRVSDFGGAHVPDRDHCAGRTVVSAKIIRFIPRPGGGATDFPTVAFRSVVTTEDHLDTAPCEYVAPHDEF